MTIVKQICLFDIHQLLEMESSHRYDAIFSDIRHSTYFSIVF